MRLRGAAATDVGLVRETNQDNYLLLESLFAVADGMGGHAAGELASAQAVETLRELGIPSTPTELGEAVQAANRAVWQRGISEPAHAGMGTTVTAVALVDDPDGEGKVLAVANVGDSRTYLLRKGKLSSLTRDHSWVQEMVRAGQITGAQAEQHPKRSTLTRALGIGGTVQVDVDVIDPEVDDRYLLCSDGLWDELTPTRIQALLETLDDPHEAAARLVSDALGAGGRDNVTVVVIHLDEVPDAGDGPELDSEAARPNGEDELRDPSKPAAGKASPELDIGEKPAELQEQSEATTAEANPRASTSEADDDADSNSAEALNSRESSDATVAVPALSSHSGNKAETAGKDRSGGSQSRKTLNVKPRRARLLSPGIIMFFLALLLVLGATAAALTYLGSNTYVVTVAENDSKTVVINKGSRGIPWVTPVEEARLPLTVDQLRPQDADAVRRGHSTSTRNEADEWVNGITQQAVLAGIYTIPGAVVGTAPSTTSPGAATTAPVTTPVTPTTAPGVPAPSPTTAVQGP